MREKLCNLGRRAGECRWVIVLKRKLAFQFTETRFSETRVP